jgi:CheY-like chemotaxis protein
MAAMDTPMIAPSHDAWSEEMEGRAASHTDDVRHSSVAPLPYARQSEPTTPQSPSLGARPEPPAILIVDDDQSIAELMAELLNDEGYRVAIAADGASAVAMARRALPALVFTDSMMPGMGGSELIRELRRHPKTRSIPVVLMSSVYPGDRRTLGVPFLAKPFGIDEVLELVACYARIRPPTQLYGEG